MSTTKHVAARAGVSFTTVSHVLHGTRRVSDSVPQALSVIGFDGIELGSCVYPALTTVGYPIRELGERAVTVLIERIASGSCQDREVVLNAQVIVRESKAVARQP